MIKVRIFNATPLTNFEIQKYHQNNAQLSLKNKPRFNGVYYRINLPKIKDCVNVINLNKYKSGGTLWIVCMLMVIM